MIQISYISSATAPMSNQDLLGLLQECRENNAQSGVTGMLIYATQRSYKCWKATKKLSMILSIRSARTRATPICRVLHRRTIERRQYSDWSMGFKRVSDKELRVVEGLRDFGEKDFNPDYLLQHGEAVQSLMNHFRKERFKTIGQSELGIDEEDPMINVLHRVIRGAVRVLAVLMVVTILWGVVDVTMVLYGQVLRPSFEELHARDIIVTFGAFLAVLIAIEIFLNITLYLRDDVVHVKLVVATALMAIARKVIVFDFAKIDGMEILGTGAVVLALGIVYWLMDRKMFWGEEVVIDRHRLMPCSENLELRNGSDSGEIGHAFRAVPFKAPIITRADVVEVAALEMSAIVVIGAPKHQDELPAVSFGREKGAWADIDDVGRSFCPGDLGKIEAPKVMRHGLPRNGLAPEARHMRKRRGHDNAFPASSGERIISSAVVEQVHVKSAPSCAERNRPRHHRGTSPPAEGRQCPP